MAKVTRIIDGVTFEERKIYRNVEGAKHDAIALVPDAPTFNTDDEAAVWLNDLVERKVMTWKQVVKWTLAQIPILAGSVAFADLATGNEPPKKMSLSDLTAAYGFHQAAIDACGPKADNPALVTDTMIRLWWQSKRTPTGEWDASKHVVLPKDI